MIEIIDASSKNVEGTQLVPRHYNKIKSQKHKCVQVKVLKAAVVLHLRNVLLMTIILISIYHFLDAPINTKIT